MTHVEIVGTNELTHVNKSTDSFEQVESKQRNRLPTWCKQVAGYLAVATAAGLLVHERDQSNMDNIHQATEEAYVAEAAAAVLAQAAAEHLTLTLNQPNTSISYSDALMGVVEDGSGQSLYRNVLLLSRPQIPSHNTGSESTTIDLMGAWIGYISLDTRTANVTIETQPWLPDWTFVPDSMKQPIESDVRLYLTVSDLSTGIQADVKAFHADPSQYNYGDVGIVGQIIEPLH